MDDNLVCMKVAATIVNARPLKLLNALEEQGVLRRDINNSRVPAQEYIDRAFFVTATTNFKKGPVTHYRTRIFVTPNGIEFLRDFIANNPVPRQHENKAAA
ncbi:MAG: phage antirepressor YoqD-like protein [Flavobacteriales bacterium]|jgi:phage antirepressor YoqD-like protein